MLIPWGSLKAVWYLQILLYFASNIYLARGSREDKCDWVTITPGLNYHVPPVTVSHFCFSLTDWTQHEQWSIRFSLLKGMYWLTIADSVISHVNINFEACIWQFPVIKPLYHSHNYSSQVVFGSHLITPGL